MKNNKNKIIIGIVIVLIAIAGIFAITKLMPKQETQAGDKNITIVIIDKTDGDKELYNKTINTSAETLGDALAETSDIQMVTESGEYGRFITSLCGVSQGDMSSGPWWLYSSTNNKSCLAAGYCNGIDETPISDGDDFTFTLSSEY